MFLRGFNYKQTTDYHTVLGLTLVFLSIQVCCLRYLNSLITFAPNSNIKVFLQTELEMAGVDTNLLLLVSPSGAKTVTNSEHSKRFFSISILTC